MSDSTRFSLLLPRFEKKDERRFSFTGSAFAAVTVVSEEGAMKSLLSGLFVTGLTGSVVFVGGSVITGLSTVGAVEAAVGAMTGAASVVLVGFVALPSRFSFYSVSKLRSSSSCSKTYLKLRVLLLGKHAAEKVLPRWRRSPWVFMRHGSWSKFPICGDSRI